MADKTPKPLIPPALGRMPSAGPSVNPFGIPEAVAPNWSKWAHREAAKLWEAVAISLNAEPGQTPTSVRMPKDFGIRLDLAVEAVALGKLRATQAWPAIEVVVLLKDFTQWAATKGLDLPVELSGVNPSSPSPTVEREPPAGIVYWRRILFLNIKKIDATFGGRATAHNVIATLKKLGDPRILSDGRHDELTWKNDNGDRRRVTIATVRNAMTDARRFAE